MPSPPPPAPRIALSRTTLTFATQRGGALPSTQAVSIDNEGGRELTWSVSDDAAWLQVSPSDGSGNHSALTVGVTTTLMPPAAYTATITVTGPAADNSPQTVAVTYTVHDVDPYIEVDSTSLSFAAVQNGAAPGPRTFHISNGGGGILNWSVSDDAEWLSLNPASGSGNSNAITATITNTSLPVDTYTATITVASTNADNSPQTLAVTYRVATAVPRIELSLNDLYWGAVRYGSLPSSRNFRITNTGAGTLDWNVSDNAGWLNVSPTSGSSNSALITASITTTDLVPGTHNATITVSSANASNSPQTIAVEYTVAEPPPLIRLDSTTLSFAATADGALPGTKSFTITNGGSGTLNWSVTDDASWLSLSPAGGSSNASTVTASITATDLAPGTYQATITVSSTNAENSPQTIAVTYTVGEPSPRIEVDSSSLSFAATEGGVLPSSKTFQITNSGGGILNWFVDDDVAWLSLFPTIGNSNAVTITASITTSGLTPGMYSATITVSSANATNSPQTIAVTYTVSAAAVARIGLSTDWIGFEAFQNGDTPPPATFTITNTGSGTLDWSVACEADWLSVYPESGMINSAEITVTVISTALSPADEIHEAVITISAGNADNSPQTIAVEFFVFADMNRILLTDYDAVPGESEVPVGVFVINKDDVRALVLPLEIRSVSGGAFITNLTFYRQGRVYDSGLMDLEDIGSYAVPAAFNSCSGPTSRTYATRGSINFVSPDALMWSGLATLSPCLEPGIDPFPSFVFVFNVNSNQGVFEIDTCCVTPANHLAMVDCGSMSGLSLEFYKGIVTIGQSRTDAARTGLKTFFQGRVSVIRQE